VLEAHVDGCWRPGVVGEMHEDAVDFREANGSLWEGVPLSKLRPWPERFLVKPDSVANDAFVVALFRLFNYLWRHSFLPAEYKPCALDFEVLPAGPNFGFVEYVEASTPVRDFDWSQLSENDEGQIRVFLRTAAGSIVAGHVLGIGDRHQDNIMVRSIEVPELGVCTQFYQLDFKHCMGSHTRIDADSIAIPLGMKEVLKQMSALPLSSRRLNGTGDSGLPPSAAPDVSNRWAELKALCGMAFRVLRRSNGFITHMSRLLLARNPELDASTVEAFLADSLCLGTSEDQAVKSLCNRIEESSRTLAKIVKDLSHTRAGSKE